MRNPLKLTLAAASLAAPLVLGVVYTAGASVGSDTGLSSHTVDQWIMSDGDGSNFTIDREEIDGEVSIVVTDTNGGVVAAGDFPDFVQDAVDEFGDDNWAPHDVEVFDIIDGTPCYHKDRLADSIDDGDFNLITSGDEGTFALESSSGGQLDAAYFEAELSDFELEAQRGSEGLFSEIAGAHGLNACP